MFGKRYVLFVLRDNEGRILLQKRDNRAPKYPGMWGFFGGSIEEGESPEQALRREALEELSLKNVKFRFFGRYKIKESDGLNEKFLFVALLDVPLGHLRKNQKEGETLGMFSFDDLKMVDIPEPDWILHMELFGEKDKAGMLYIKKKK